MPQKGFSGGGASCYNRGNPSATVLSSEEYLSWVLDERRSSQEMVGSGMMALMVTMAETVVCMSKSSLASVVSS